MSNFRIACLLGLAFLFGFEACNFTLVRPAQAQVRDLQTTLRRLMDADRELQNSTENLEHALKVTMDQRDNFLAQIKQQAEILRLVGGDRGYGRIFMEKK